MKVFPKIFIFIWDLPEFVLQTDMPGMDENGEELPSMSPFLANLWDKGAFNNVFWIAAINSDDRSKVLGFETFELFTRAGRGIHLGGKVGEQQLMTFEHIPYGEMGKGMKPGIGLLPTHDEDDTTEVVLPLYKTE
ncbi:MAG: hypothetical protein IJ679_09850 [Lachnospiraceae bacterium]|nr:hypothetical protein [Lachnospiraceae bacterium]